MSSYLIKLARHRIPKSYHSLLTIVGQQNTLNNITVKNCSQSHGLCVLLFVNANFLFYLKKSLCLFLVQFWTSLPSGIEPISPTFGVHRPWPRAARLPCASGKYPIHLHQFRGTNWRLCQASELCQRTSCWPWTSFL